jgi:hypothetical protein
MVYTRDQFNAARSRAKKAGEREALRLAGSDGSAAAWSSSEFLLYLPPP